MQKKHLLEMLKDVPDDAQIVISKTFVIGEDDEFTAVIDCPVIAIAINDDMSDGVEIRFVLDSESLSKCFNEDEIKYLDEQDRPELEIEDIEEDIEDDAE